MKVFHSSICSLFFLGQFLFGIQSAHADPLSFTFQKAIDQTINLPVMDVFLPENWTMQVYTDWQRCSASSIASAIINLRSPDGNTEIVFTTPDAFTWGTSSFNHNQLKNIPSYNQGCDIAKRTFYLPYVNAKDYIKLCLKSWNMTSTQTLPVNTASLDQQFKHRMLPLMKNMAEGTVRGVLSSLNRVYTNGGIQGLAAEMATTQELINVKGYTKYSEHTAVTYGFTTFFSTAPISRQLGSSMQTNTFWKGQIISYYASSEEQFNRNYALYKTVVENSRYNPQWFYVSDYYGRRMMDAVQKGISIALGQINILEAIKDGESKNEPVDSTQYAEAMSDTILERNDYTDHEGKHFKVDTKYDVYRDADNKYHIVESGRSAPYGYEKLTPNSARDY